MKESYCIVDKRVTPCTEPSGYQQDKRGRTQFYCKCAVCGNKKVVVGCYSLERKTMGALVS